MSIKIPTFKDVQYMANPSMLDTFVRHYAPQMSPDAERLFRETLAAVIDEATKPLILYVDGDGKPIDAPDVVHATPQHSDFSAPPEMYVGGKDVEDAPEVPPVVVTCLACRGTGFDGPVPHDGLDHAEMCQTCNGNGTVPKPSTAPPAESLPDGHTWGDCPICGMAACQAFANAAPPADEWEWFTYPDVRPPYGVPVTVDFGNVILDAYRRTSGHGTDFYETTDNSAQWWCMPVRWRFVADQPKADAPVETDEPPVDNSDAAIFERTANKWKDDYTRLDREAARTINELRTKLDNAEMFRLRACNRLDDVILQRDELRAQLEMQSKLITENLDEIDKLRTWVTKLQREKQGLESRHFDPIKIERDELRESLESASAQLNQANAEIKQLTVECWTKRDEHKQAGLERGAALAQLDAEMRKHNDLRDSIRQSAAILTKALMD